MCVLKILACNERLYVATTEVLQYRQMLWRSKNTNEMFAVEVFFVLIMHLITCVCPCSRHSAVQALYVLVFKSRHRIKYFRYLKKTNLIYRI